MGSGHWSDEENDAIVSDYFAMLKFDLMGETYNKSQHRRDLQKRIDRPNGSIEYKHQNISAVLLAMGEPWIIGYKPAYNYQDSLIAAVVRHLDRQSETLETVVMDQPAAPPQIEFHTAPTLRNAPPPKELDQVMAVARKFDVAARQERNRALGRAGENRVLIHERHRLRAAGRKDLAGAVRWVSEEDGDGAGYDIASFEENGDPRLIEVKTTNGWERTPFHISANELAVSEDRAREWCLVRLWNFARTPAAFELRPPLSGHVALTSTSFRAEFSGHA